MATRLWVTTVVTATARAIIAIAAPHHDGRPFFEFVDAKSNVAQHVFVDAHLTFHLVYGVGWRIDIHEGVMALAVLLDLVGKRPQAPAFFLRDRSASVHDHFFEGFDQPFNLSGRNVLACDEHTFVVRQSCLLPLAYLNPTIGA